jgi:hypothetical protein
MLVRPVYSFRSESTRVRNGSSGTIDGSGAYTPAIDRRAIRRSWLRRLRDITCNEHSPAIHVSRNDLPAIPLMLDWGALFAPGRVR